MTNGGASSGLNFPDPTAARGLWGHGDGDDEDDEEEEALGFYPEVPRATSAPGCPHKSAVGQEALSVQELLNLEVLKAVKKLNKRGGSSGSDG